MCWYTSKARHTGDGGRSPVLQASGTWAPLPADSNTHVPKQEIDGTHCHKRLVRLISGEKVLGKLAP